MKTELKSGKINWVSKDKPELDVYRSEVDGYAIACFAKDEAEALEIISRFAKENNLKENVSFVFAV